jgi:hypothetical protein
MRVNHFLHHQEDQKQVITYPYSDAPFYISRHEKNPQFLDLADQSEGLNVYRGEKGNKKLMISF